MKNTGKFRQPFTPYLPEIGCQKEDNSLISHSNWNFWCVKHLSVNSRATLEDFREIYRHSHKENVTIVFFSERKSKRKVKEFSRYHRIEREQLQSKSPSWERFLQPKVKGRKALCSRSHPATETGRHEWLPGWCLWFAEHHVSGGSWWFEKAADVKTMWMKREWQI